MRIIFCTAKMDEAKRIAKLLLEHQIAACVNLIPVVLSYYRWHGKLCEDQETLLVIKTKASLMNEVMDLIRKCHSYETIEILGWDVQEGDDKYIQWVFDSTK